MLTQDEQFRMEAEEGRKKYESFRTEAEEMRKKYESEHSGELRAGSAQRSISPGATIGSVVGGVAGGVVGGPGGAVAGAIAGAGVGELAQQGYDRMTNSAYAPHSFEESAKRVGSEMGFATAGEVGAAGVMGAKALVFGRPVLYGQARQLTPEQLKTKAYMDQHNIPYTADQITGSAFHNLARAMADNGVFSEQGMTLFMKNQNAAIRQTVSDVADTMGQHVPIDKLGAEVAQYIGDRSKVIQDAIVDPWYNTIGQHLQYTQQTVQAPTGKMVPHPNGSVFGLVPETAPKNVTQGGLLVNTRPLKDAFAKEVAELEKNAINTGDTNFAKLKESTPAYETMKQFLSVEDDIQWVAAHQELKRTREQLRRLDNPLDTVSSRQYDKGRLIKAEGFLEQQMELALKNSADPSHQADLALWRQAQAVVKGKSEQFRNDVVLRFVKAIDEHGGDKGMTQFMNTMTAEDMGKVLKAVRSEPELQDKMRRSFLEDRINKAGGMADAEAPFDAIKFRKLVFGKDESAALKTNVLFDEKQQMKLKEFIDAVEHVQSNKGGTLGAVFIKLQSSSALFSLPKAALGSLGLAVGGAAAYSAGHGDSWTAAGEAGAAIGIVFGPNLLASMLKNPRMTEYMIQGLRYSAANSGAMTGGTPVFNTQTGQWQQVGGKFSPSTTSQIVRVTREMMRLDQGFAQAVRAGVSAYNAEQTSGPIHRTAETVQKGMAETVPSIFGNQQ